MTFGFSGWVSNNADTSVDMAYPSYTNVLGTGSKSSGTLTSFSSAAAFSGIACARRPATTPGLRLTSPSR